MSDFFLDCFLHTREVQIKHWVVGNADAVVHNVLQRQGHSVAQGRNDCLTTRHFGHGKHLVPHVGVQGTGTGCLADGRQQRIRHSLGTRAVSWHRCSEGQGAGTNRAGTG